MIRLQASFALAVALIALGAAQASAELIHVEANNPAFNVGDQIGTVLSGSTLPDVAIKAVAANGLPVPGDANPSVTLTGKVLIETASGSSQPRVFAAGASNQAAGFVDSWQAFDWDSPTGDPGYALKADFMEEPGRELVSYLEVDFLANSELDWGWVRVKATDGAIIDATVDLRPVAGTLRTLKLTVPEGISELYATGYGDGVNVLITGIRYGTGPELPAVPEPASVVTLLLGCVGLPLLRKRLA